MRMYQTLSEAYGEIQRDLVEMGSDVHPETYQDKDIKNDEKFWTKELQGYTYCLTNVNNLAPDFSKLGGNVGYVLAEHTDRVSCDWRNPGKSWEFRKETWAPFLKNGKFSYTYNERFREQLPMIIEELRKNPNTRQAIITMYDRHQDMANIGGKARIPCSMHYQFLLRKSPLSKDLALDLIYTMRSCDIYTHFLYDVYLSTMLQHYVAGAVGVDTGRFIHFIGSLHAYKKDYDIKGIF